MDIVESIVKHDLAEVRNPLLRVARLRADQEEYVQTSQQPPTTAPVT